MSDLYPTIVQISQFELHCEGMEIVKALPVPTAIEESSLAFVSIRTFIDGIHNRSVIGISDGSYQLLKQIGAATWRIESDGGNEYIQGMSGVRVRVTQDVRNFEMYTGASLFGN